MQTVKFLTTVDPQGSATTVKFLVGTTEENLAQVGEPIELEAGNDPVPVELTTDLESATDYFVKATAENEDGIAESLVVAFTTPEEVGDGVPVITEVTVEFL